MKRTLLQKNNFKKQIGFVFAIFILLAPHFAFATINKQINYQAKLTTPANVGVADGSYSVRFKIYTQPTGGSPIWTEAQCYSPDSGVTCNGTGTDNRVAVSSGLFSTMLGSITSLVGVDFNTSTLYLGVEIGGSNASSTWDGEMVPRKVIGSVPSAFVADTLQGLTPSAFFRTDTTNSTSSASTFLSVIQTGAGKIAEFFGQNSSSVLSILSNGNVGVGSSTPSAILSVQSSLATLLTNPIFAVASSSGNTLFNILGNGDVNIPGSGPTLITSTSSNPGGHTVISGRYLYVNDSSSNSLAVYDVTNPAAPAKVGVGPSGTLTDLVVSGRYVYGITGSSQLAIYDVSNPSAPTLTGTTSAGLSAPVSIAISGHYVYVDDTTVNGLVIFDVSNPAAPVKVGSIATSVSTALNYVTVSGKYAYAINTFFGNHLVIFDISNPAAPTIVSDTVPTLASGLQSIAVSGRFAYLVDRSNTYAFRIMDISNPSAPTTTATISQGFFGNSIPNSVVVAGNYAYFTNHAGTTPGLWAVNVSNPAAPVLKGFVNLLGTSNSGQNVIAVSGHYAYVVDNGLNVIDLGGLDVNAENVGSLEAGSLQVRNDIIGNGNLSIIGGINVGTQGIFSVGGLSTLGALTALNFTGTSTGSNTGDLTLGTGNGLSLLGQILSLNLASSTGAGALSAIDWNTFNNKLSTSTAAATYVPYTGATGSVNLNNQSLVNLSTLTVGSTTAPTGGVAWFNGNVGIGTSTPSNKLSIFASLANSDIGLTSSYTTSSWTCGSPVTGTDGLTYGTVLGEDGQCWLDRNLGAARVATAYNDTLSYGALYQWGRGNDGHQSTSSPVSGEVTLNAGGYYLPNGGPYTSIASPYASYFATSSSDWLPSQNDNLWQGVSGVNNACPAGFRLPTQTEWSSYATAAGNSNIENFTSALKLPLAGYRDRSSASLGDQGSIGYYWSSSPHGSNAFRLLFSSGSVNPANITNRAYGISVRCIKDSGSTISPVTQYSNWALGINQADNSFRIGEATALGSADKFVIGSTGNVGIGTSSPSAQLTVAGNGLVTGTMTVNGALSALGGLSVTGALSATGLLSAQNFTGTSTGSNTGDLTLAVASSTGLSLSGQVLSINSLYNLPLIASTTNWQNFLATPSGTITAGTGLSWSGNTINTTGLLSTTTAAATYVPYTGATGGVNLNNQSLTNLSTLTVGSNTAPTGGVAWFNGNVGIGVATSTNKLSIFASLANSDIGLTSSYASSWSCGSPVSGTDGLTYGTVLGEDGQCWLDRNLGAARVATAYNDVVSYGALYQWGRGNDGHQSTSSPVSGEVTLAAGNYYLPNGGPYTSIASPYASYFATSSSDWLPSQNDNLWQGVSGVNNACPAGFRLPTEDEWVNYTYRAGITDVAGNNRTCGSNCLAALASTSLKIPAAGYRDQSSASLYNQGSGGYYWSSSPYGSNAFSLDFFSGNVHPASNNSRADGFSVRCIKDSGSTISPVTQYSNWALGINQADQSFRIGEATALGSADKFVIGSTGNVGIGTTTPSALLTVAGNGLVTGTLTVNGAVSALSSLSVTGLFSALNFTGTSTGSNTGDLTLAVASSTGLSLSGQVLSINSLYNLPLIASTTNWQNFLATPSGTITAGTGLSWSGNTINTTGLLSTTTAAATYVPYTGATGGVNLNNQSLTNLSTLTVGSNTAPTGGVAWFNGNVGIGAATSTNKLSIFASLANSDIGLTSSYASSWSCGSPVSGTDGLTYGTVLGEDGHCWLDRNLGATQVATSLTDYHAYGSLFQWGRLADGHQLITWHSGNWGDGTAVNGTTASLSSTDNPGTSSFITINSGNNDWRNPQNDSLWQGVNGTNQVCPAGFRLPTSTEWTSYATAAGNSNIENGTSALKLPLAGNRDRSSASLFNQGNTGYYWSSSVNGTYAFNLYFASGFVYPADFNYRAGGFSVRCIKDSGSTIPPVTQYSNWALGINQADQSFRIGEATALGSADKFVIGSTGNVGIGTSTPTSLLTVQGTATSASTTSLFSIASSTGLSLLSVLANGDVGIGSAAPQRALDVLDVSNPQLRLSQTNSSIYTEFQVAPSTGDLTVSVNPNTTAKNIFFNQPGGTTGANLWVCQGTSCPSLTLLGGGNIVANNWYYFGNGMRIGMVDASTTAVYDTTNTIIMQFDEGTSTQ